MEEKKTLIEKTLIDCRDVALGYEGKALSRHLSFQVHSGDYLCIVGENGTGKSTLLKVLLSLLKPMEGQVVMDRTLKAGAIGYLPQQTRAQRDFPATVYEVVLSGFLSARKGRFFYTAAEKSKALMNMGKLGVLELKDRCYRELSGGQQQRVLLARAMCATKKLLLLDEPVTGLDPVAANEMYNLIKLVNLCDNTSVIMISHDIHAAVRYATHILHLGHSQLFFGTTAQYRESDLARRFVGGERA